MGSDLSGVTCDLDLVRQWLRGRPDSTRRAYKPVAIEFIEGMRGGLKGADVERVTAYVEGLQGEPATRARLVSTIKSLLSWAWRTGYVEKNLGKTLRCVKVPSKLHTKLLSEEDVKALCGACPPGRDHALLVLLYVSGLRISEAVSVTWGDLRGCHLSVTGKGTRSRTVLIPASVGDLLRSLQGDVQQPRQKAIFLSATTGEALGVRAAREAVYKASLRVGDRLPPHWLRHAHASHALDRGCPIHVVQQGLGHASVSTTSKYLYVKPGVGPSQWLVSPV